MRKLIILPVLMTAMIISSCSSCNNNKKEVQEADPNVIVLFDGQTFEGWRL